jgi:NDP-sugar pyrophosphorylase family protein
MKCLINCSAASADWVRGYFPQTHPYMLKIANKPLLEFYIDFCSLLGIRHVRLIMEEPDVSIDRYFMGGAKWDIEISYGFTRGCDDIDDIISKNRNFIGESSLMLISDYVFLRYDKEVNYASTIRRSSSWQMVGEEDGGLRYIHASDMDKKVEELDLEQYKTGRVDLVRIDSIKKYYHINMILLYETATNYILPCYNNEEGFFIGHNVSMDRHCMIKKPTMLGDNIQLEDFSSVGPGAIIGSNVMISSGTTVENSIIYECSYLGEHLEFRNKIVHKNTVINPLTGESIELVDDFLLSEVNTDFISNSVKVVRCRIFALCLYLVMLPFYLVGRLLCGVKKQNRSYYRDRLKQIFELPCFTVAKDGMLQRLFFKFSLDKVPLLGKVVSGKMHLIGNAPCPENESLHGMLLELPWYRPAVFSYSEMLGHEDYQNFEHIIHELFYCHHETPWLNLKIIIKSLVQRIFSPTSPVFDKSESAEHDEGA